jgi:hypothetical protein
MPEKEIEIAGGMQQLPFDQPVSKRVAFGGFVKPENYDIYGDYDFDTLSDVEKAWMNPDKLRSILMPMEKGNNTSISVDGVLLNQTEYSIIVRSPNQLGIYAVANVLKDKDLTDDVIQAGNRARIRILSQKEEAMSFHKDRIKENRTLLRELRKEISTPGFAHKTPERMKQLTSVAWNEYMNILDVLRVQREWNDEKHNQAKTALTYYLTQGAQKDRVKHWDEMTELADQYMTVRISLFTNRVRKVQAEIDKYQESAED